jgi:hypothetical protein
MLNCRGLLVYTNVRHDVQRSSRGSAVLDAAECVQDNEQADSVGCTGNLTLCRVQNAPNVLRLCYKAAVGRDALKL